MNKENLEYMYGLMRFGMKPGLERMEKVMQELGNPEQQFASVHISGTNGKGSVAAMMESVLRASGKKTGLYTSPHMYAFNERIRINNVPITDTELSNLVDEVRSAAERANVTLPFFEFTTALCYLHFSRTDIDIAVIEVGMGGLLDATNVITPKLSIITTIGLDHQEFLGKTEEAIAKEKAGIIKPKVPCVVGNVSESVGKVIASVAAKVDAPVHSAADICHVIDSNTLNGVQTIQVAGAYNGEVALPLRGEHQQRNLVVALAGLSALHVDFEHVQRGIADTTWEGRLDVVSQRPYILIDGAHNVDGMRALMEYVAKLPRRDVLILGLKQNRAVNDIVKELAGMFTHVIASEGSYMPYAAQDIANNLEVEGVEVEKDIAAAIAKAKTLAGDDGTIVITGSLYLVAAALGVLRPN